MRRLSGTGRRLLVAFGSLILVFAIAAGYALRGMDEIHRGVQALREREQGVVLALQLASAVRDQYAHQAHTIILGNKSHLGFYGAAQEQVLSLTRQIRARANSAQEREWVAEIEATSIELDDLFRVRIVPAMLAGRSDEVQSAHGRGLALVEKIQERVDRLVERFELSIRDFEQQAQDVAHATYRTTAAALLAVVLLAAGIALYIGRSIAVPLGQLSAGTKRLAAGDLDARIPIDRPDEFGALARRFNDMTGALKEHRDQLVQSEKLAGVGRLAAGVAHEINNPLGVILGYARLMERRADPALAADLRVIEDEAVRAKEIVEGLLDLARPMKVTAAPVDLGELCEDVVERLREAGRLRATPVAISGAAQCEGTAPKLRQVILNLLTNACDAAGDTGRVQVTLREESGSAVLSVADSGPGIAADAQRRLFEPFFTTKSTGTGLGLAVSRAIAHAHGGELEALKGPLGGAEFRLTLPQRQKREA